MSDNFARLLALMSNGGGGGVSSYNDLTDLPSIGGTTIIGDLTLTDIGVVIDNQLDATSTNPVQNAIITAALNNLSYNNLSNKPSINNVTLTGNTTLAELGLYAIWIGTNAELEAAIEDDEIADGTIILLTDDPDVDNLPTANSTNLVYSGGVYTFVTQGLSGKVDAVQGKGLSTNDYTDAEKAQVATNKNDITALKAEHVELTQAEYDMIGSEKYSDDKEYFITDAEPDSPTYIYGFHIDPDESDPSDAVTYLKDAIGMTPAAMGSTAFNYGSWVDAFFIPKPCMVRSNGTVDYYLNPNDYTKKVDGTASDIANLDYDGNAMMEWGLIWWKYEAGTAEGEGYFYVSNHRVDSSYKCWCNYDSKNNITDHFYTAIYNGTSAPIFSTTSTYAVNDHVTYNNAEYKCITAIETAGAWDSSKWEQVSATTRLRSLSGIALTPANGNGSTTGQTEIARATANNTTVDTEWYIDVWSDCMLINGLLILMGKSLDSQGVFGRGIDTGSQAGKEAYVTGTLNDKGLFYGSTANGTTAVKVFGMENWWALVWRRTAGLVGLSNGTTAVKMTYGTADGTTADGYNTTGTGYYIDTNVRPASGYMAKARFNALGYYLPSVTTGGSATTRYCDYWYANNVATTFALVGGGSGGGVGCGSSCFDLRTTVGYATWNGAAAPSLKPLAQKG